MSRLNDKVAIITGGAGEIGKETAKSFLREGAKVSLVDLSEEQLSEVKQSLDSFGEVITIQADVSQEEDVEKYVNKTMEQFGKIDIFFNNAAIEGKTTALIEQTVEDFDKVYAVNVRGVFLGLKYVLPIMMKQEGGSIINTASAVTLMGSPGQSPYSASKHAVVGLTNTSAVEVASHNIRVNSIHPAPVNTRMIKAIEKDINPENPMAAREELTNLIPLGRYGEPDDIAKIVLFLASDESAFITGSQYRVDGGIVT